MTHRFSFGLSKQRTSGNDNDRAPLHIILRTSKNLPRTLTPDWFLGFVTGMLIAFGVVVFVLAALLLRN